MPAIQATIPTPQTLDLKRVGADLSKNAATIVGDLTLVPLPAGNQGIANITKLMDQKNIAHLIVLDQKVPGIENIATRTSYGYEYQSDHYKITVIDHHVNDQEFAKLSTGNLVLEYFKLHPEGPPKEAEICITHGDCDSVLSALMMLKKIPAEKEFATATLSADHEFRSNPIADLLQAIETIPRVGEVVQGKVPTMPEILVQDPLYHFRQGVPELPFFPSLETSIKNLGLLLEGAELEPLVSEKMSARFDARAKWDERIKNGEVKELTHGTYYCVIPDLLEHDPCPEFLLDKIPNANVILVFHNNPADQKFMQVRALLGLGAPEHLALDNQTLISDEIVPGFGGRKNAGSNKRGGISLKEAPEIVAKMVDDNLSKQLV